MNLCIYVCLYIHIYVYIYIYMCIYVKTATGPPALRAGPFSDDFHPRGDQSSRGDLTSSHRIHSMVTFRKSAPPQNRQLIADYTDQNLKSAFLWGS